MALALVAAAVLVLSDNARWLRLAVVSALWAALVGAFLAARYRRQVADREDEVADLQSVYELELEREVAARREFELEIEAEARQRVQDESRDDLAKLREELSALRQNLEALLGGEVLVERVALRAESTRMRSLSDQSRLMAVGDQRIISTENERIRSLGPGPSKTTTTTTTKKVPEKVVPVSDRTELIERVVVESPPRRETRPEPPRREAARPEPARPEPNRQPNRTEPVRREPARSQQQQRSQQLPVVVRRDPPKPPPPPPEPPRREQPTSRVSRAELMDSMELRLNGLAPAPERRSEPLRRAEPAKPAMSKPIPPKPAPPKPTPPPPPPPKPAPEPPRRGRAAERTEMISPEPLLDRPSSDSRTNLTPPRTSSSDSRTNLTPPRISPSSSRTNLTPVGESTGGRRRADERPSWDSLGGWESSREEPPKSGRRSAPDPEPPAGAHADGKSVSELLASLGNADSPRRRRRRED
jgi:hypothetical protein